MNKWTYSIFLSLIAFACTAQNALQKRIDRFADKAELKHAAVSISVMDIASEKLVASINPDMSLIPASSLKLITTLTAVDLLGADYRYQTDIAYSGQIDPDGTLTGDLYIIGSGDPTLGKSRIEGVADFRSLMKEIANKVKDRGITCIDGKVIADESIFNSYPISPSWQWNDLGNYYASGAWGINLNENEYFVYFNRNAGVGYMTTIHGYEPYVPNLILENEVSIDSSNTPDNAYIFGGPYNYDKRIVGTIPFGKGRFRIKGSIPDPPLFAAYHIKDQLSRYQISSTGYKATHEKYRKKRKAIHIIKSPPLKKIAALTNERSINIYAEALLKTIGHEKRKEGSGGAGLYALNKHLKKIGLNRTPLHMEDGSGLSARNVMSSQFMCQFLAKMYDRIPQNILTEIIPHPGGGSTVSASSIGSARTDMWVKSGSMERVQTFSGYIRAKSGKWLSFSIMANGLHVKNKKVRPLMGKLMREIWEKG